MKSNRVRGLAFLAGATAGFLSLTLSHLAFAAGLGWFNNFEQALQTARQQGRPIFVDFSTSWCSVCKQMDRTTLSDPAVIGRLDNFVKVKVDGDARPDLVNAYAVEAYPTFLHLDASGRIMEKREGFMRVQEMAGTLDRTWQSVSASLAVAQANSNQNTVQQPQAGATQFASTDLQLLPVEGRANAPRESRAVSNDRVPTTPESAAAGSLYNMTDPQLQGGRNVYAMDSGPTSERRSRFGGSAGSNQQLRELAEATAQPGAIEESSAAGSSERKKPAKADEEMSQAPAKAVEAKSTKEATAPASSEKASPKTEVVTPRDSESEKKELAKPAVEVARAVPSPVIESRLTGLSDAELPKPLLSRTAGAGTQAMAPATIVSTSSQADPLATIRRIQGDDGTARPAVSGKSQPITAEAEKQAEPAKSPEKPTVAATAAAPAPAEKVDEQRKASEESRQIASAASPKPAVASSEKKSEPSTTAKKTEPASSEPKTAEGATRSDIERWMKDADSKLVSDRKKEARAMYAKVVEKDPDNKFGKSDMAYVKMVSLIVDRDSDRLRMEAYSKIKEFEARYPESDHKDYYTLIRAILATDLGETNEAHKLLGTFADRFPDSKYKKIAHETWKDLPPVKKESSTKSASSSSSSKAKKSSS